MGSKIKERCIYCGGDVFYDGSEPLVKCQWCGQTLAVAKFENELLRIQKAEEENVLIKEQLKEAELEKQTANDRLFAALSDLGEIRDEQDVLGKTLHLLSEGQGDALQSLEFLKSVSERLLSTQNNFVARLGVVQDIAIQLQKIDMAEQERQSAMNEFMLWSQQIREEDVQRLQGIASSADMLIEGQREIKNKVDELKAAADLHQQTLEAFRGQYTKDKLEKIQKLYRQAEDYQHDRRYDKAEEYYRRALTEGNEEAEVYWRLIMCHYCLFYEKDGDGRMIPIILNPDLTDPAEMSLRKELAMQMTEQEKTYYDVKLQEIDRILDKYRLLKEQVQYDVFISVKQDDGGRYTADSDVASDLYDFLASHGLRVFNSRRTVIPVGQEYEPYIISALISSKVLIVVGTTPENMNSNWVKNEWSRFQWLQFRDKEKTGKTERVLFCYLAKGMRAEQIPRALHPDRQAIYDGVKAQSDLLSVLSFIRKTDTAAEGLVYMPVSTAKPDYDRIRKQMTLWLVRGKFDKVLEKYEQLNEEGLFLSHVSLHMTALCANNRVADIMQIINSDFILEDAPEYKAAVLLCDEEKEKRTLNGYLAQNREWREKQNNKSITPNNKEIEKEREADSGQEAKKKQYSLEESEANTIRFGRYVQKKNGTPEPIEWQVLERKNGRMLVISKYALDCQPYNASLESVTWETCSLRKWLNETFVNNAFNTDEQKRIVSSKVMADKNPSYSTSPGNDTTDKVFLLSITEVNEYFNTDKVRECQGTAYCYARGAYKASNDNCRWWLRSPGHRSRNASYVLIGGSVDYYGDVVHDAVAVRPALWIDLENEAPKSNHENDLNLTPEVQFGHNKKEIEKEQEAAPGQETEKKQQNLEESESNSITFGRYVQKKNGSPEPIEWQVLKRENGRMLVISKYALDCKPYNTSLESVTWETCSLRKWLNETFVNNAFNTDEQKMIISTEVTADKNPSYSTSPGNNTIDKVFLLSITEANKYFDSDEARRCQGTAYCYAQGAKSSLDWCWWWLRSPGCRNNYAAYVLRGGFVKHDGRRVSFGPFVSHTAVRPALWIDLESEKKKKEEETEKTKAEAEGQAISQENPEEWYKRGKEAYGKKNYTEAVMWWRKAADQDDVNAQIALGDFYDAQYNRKEAVYWYQKAADQGDPSAQWHLETPLPEPDLDPEGPDNDNSSSEESEDLAAMFDELFGSPCE